MRPTKSRARLWRHNDDKPRFVPFHLLVHLQLDRLKDTHDGENPLSVSNWFLLPIAVSIGITAQTAYPKICCERYRNRSNERSRIHCRHSTQHTAYGFFITNSTAVLSRYSFSASASLSLSLSLFLFLFFSAPLWARMRATLHKQHGSLAGKYTYLFTNNNTR